MSIKIIPDRVFILAPSARRAADAFHRELRIFLGMELS